VGRPRKQREAAQRELQRRRNQQDLAAQMRSGAHDTRGFRPAQPQFFSQLEHYQGPLPHPKILQEFEQLVPGSAATIMGNFRVESDHRRSMERDESEAARGFFARQLDYRDRGQKMGFVIALLGLVVAGYAFYKNEPWAGGVIAGVDLVALVALFITGKRGDPKPATQAASTEVART
jgi:uncharacterized membrane protein